MTRTIASGKSLNNDEKNGGDSYRPKFLLYYMHLNIL